MLTESLEVRLKWLQENYCASSTVDLYVEETDKPGEARVRCRLRGYAIAVNLHQKPFSCLKLQKCADGFIFHRLSSGDWELHVIECKRTVTESEWMKIKQQFEGAILNALAVSGILGLSPLVRVRCYVAHRHDKLSPNPILLKATLGRPIQQSPPVDWIADRIDLLSLKNIEHIKIQLDPATGLGEVQL